MSGLLNLPPGDCTARNRARCSSLRVAGSRYSNTAAKFWPALLAEVHDAFPAWGCLHLEASCCGLLDVRKLHPEVELTDTLNALEGADIPRLMQQTLATLELTGPPGPIELSVLDGEQQALFSGTLPLDCVDSETFPYLAGWLLQWAEVPPETWNRQRLEAGFDAMDDRGLRYGIQFAIENRHLSEGLFRRVVEIRAQVAVTT